MKLLVLVCALAAVAAFATPRGHATAVCRPLPPRLLGDYERADNHTWTLSFFADCTYDARTSGVVEGAGQYTVTTGAGLTSGVLVFSNDRGCPPPGQNLPTPYTFALVTGVLLLAPQLGAGADLCVAANGDGRAKELAGHGGWIKLISGAVRISTKGTRVGTFKARGVFADQGTFAQTRRAQKTRILRFSGVNGRFTLTERMRAKGKLTWKLGSGSGGYASLTGSGVGVAKGSSAALHGDVTN